RLGFYKNEFEGDIAQVLRQVFSGWVRPDLPGAAAQLRRLAARKGAMRLGSGQRPPNAGGVPVYDGLLSRSISDPQHAPVAILEFNLVVLWIDLHRVLAGHQPPPCLRTQEYVNGIKRVRHGLPSASVSSTGPKANVLPGALGQDDPD